LVKIIKKIRRLEILVKTTKKENLILDHMGKGVISDKPEFRSLNTLTKDFLGIKSKDSIASVKNSSAKLEQSLPVIP